MWQDGHCRSGFAAGMSYARLVLGIGIGELEVALICIVGLGFPYLVLRGVLLARKKARLAQSTRESIERDRSSADWPGREG